MWIALFFYNAKPKFKSCLSVTHSLLTSPSNDCTELLYCFVLALQLTSLWILRFLLPTQILKTGRHMSQLRPKERQALSMVVNQQKTHMVLLFQSHMLRTRNCYQEFSMPRKVSEEKNNTVRCMCAWKAKTWLLQADGGVWFTTAHFKEETRKEPSQSG